MFLLERNKLNRLKTILAESKNIFIDEFACYKHAAFLLRNTLIDGLESCELLWCFYQLFGLWRHPFTAEDPFLQKPSLVFHRWESYSFGMTENIQY